MIKLAGTWHIKAGDDVEKIDKHYFDVHVPNVRRLPKLKRHVTGKALFDAAGGHPAAYRTAEIWFANREDFDARHDVPRMADHRRRRLHVVRCRPRDHRL